PPVGGAVERGVVEHDGHAVRGRPDVQLDRVGALPHRQLEGGEGILGGRGRRSPVGDHRPGGEVEQRHPPSRARGARPCPGPRGAAPSAASFLARFGVTMSSFSLRLLAGICALTLPAAGRAQAPAGAPRPPARILVHAGRLIDGLADTPRAYQGILIEGERIVAVGPYADLEGRAAGAERIDLGRMTVLPGLIDNHTHILLQGDITAADYDEQLLKESIPYRTIRATVAARKALMNGFTTLRDLETEGAMYADVDV